MSYNINVRKDGAGVVITGTSGDVPDGEWSVSGHEDGAGRSVGVTQYTPQPSHLQVASASSWSSKTLGS